MRSSKARDARQKQRGKSNAAKATRQRHVRFSRTSYIMTPVWFPWMFVGGLLFIVLSFIGAKYKEKEYRSIQYLQDFISGSILIAFTGVLIPDVFPAFPALSTLSTMSALSALSLPTQDAFDEMEMVQVGPPRLMRR